MKTDAASSGKRQTAAARRRARKKPRPKLGSEYPPGFIDQFMARASRLSDEAGLEVCEIKYINRGVAHLTLSGGSTRFLSVGNPNDWYVFKHENGETE